MREVSQSRSRRRAKKGDIKTRSSSDQNPLTILLRSKPHLNRGSVVAYLQTKGSRYRSETKHTWIDNYTTVNQQKQVCVNVQKWEGISPHSSPLWWWGSSSTKRSHSSQHPAHLHALIFSLIYVSQIILLVRFARSVGFLKDDISSKRGSNIPPAEENSPDTSLSHPNTPLWNSRTPSPPKNLNVKFETYLQIFHSLKKKLDK